MPLRPLAPKSRKLYDTMLKRAFGKLDPPFIVVPAIFDDWSNDMKSLLRAAIARAYHERSMSKVALAEIIERIPFGYAIKRMPKIPTEDEATKYEKAANKLVPHKRALALLPLALGLRARELCALTREEVKRAVQTGELKFVRKGGEEHILNVRESTKNMLKDLLDAKKAPPGRIAMAAVLDVTRVWQHVGDILSVNETAQYNYLLKLVHDTAVAAGIGELTPHKLRHAFATRLNRDGANLFTIQYALNHKHISTTQKYVHPSADDVARYMREFNAHP